MIGVPKPSKRTDSEKRVDALTKAWKRKDRWRAKAIAKAKGKPRPKVRQRNEARIKQKAKAYRAVIASDFERWLRYEAYKRSGGLCECEQCVAIRNDLPKAIMTDEPHVNILLAFTGFEIWFVQGGGAAYKRFRSNDCELHHHGAKGVAPYHYFGQENPEELKVVRLTHKVCHRRIEAQFGTRRRFLKGK